MIVAIATGSGGFRRLSGELASYTHWSVDVRDRDGLAKIFARYGRDIHTANVDRWLPGAAVAR